LNLTKNKDKKKYLENKDNFFDQSDDFYFMLRREELNKEIYNFWKSLSK